MDGQVCLPLSHAAAEDGCHREPQVADVLAAMGAGGQVASILTNIYKVVSVGDLKVLAESSLQELEEMAPGQISPIQRLAIKRMLQSSLHVNCCAGSFAEASSACPASEREVSQRHPVALASVPGSGADVGVGGVVPAVDPAQSGSPPHLPALKSLAKVAFEEKVLPFPAASEWSDLQHGLGNMKQAFRTTM